MAFIICVMEVASLRVARACSSLDSHLAFYRDGLGMNVLGSFEGHAGYDGVMLGHDKLGFHLEFTVNRNNPNEQVRAPSSESLLVFYFPTKEQYETVVERMKSHGYQPVSPENPFWLNISTLFEDPDGYHVVLTDIQWK